MNPDAQRIAIAEACGWKLVIYSRGKNGQPLRWEYVHSDGRKVWYDHMLPDYLNDLNAMHKAIHQAVGRDGWDFQRMFVFHLDGITQRRRRELNPDQITFWMTCATASQLAEAFLKTLGLWKEDEKHTRSQETCK